MESTRRTPRYPFVAPAEVTPQPSGTKLETKVKELSLYGCYLDTPSPLPVRTRVTIKICGRDEFFEATATVIYANPMLGMGLVFREVRPGYMEVLRRWLLQAMQQTALEDEGRTPDQGSLSGPNGPDDTLR